LNRQKKNVYKILVRKPEGTLGHRCEVNIMMDLKETGRESWPTDTVRWRALAKTWQQISSCIKDMEFLD